MTVTLTMREGDHHQGCRTRLVADVVSGKLDVREATACHSEVDPLVGVNGPSGEEQATGALPVEGEVRAPGTEDRSLVRGGSEGQEAQP